MLGAVKKQPGKVKRPLSLIIPALLLAACNMGGDPAQRAAEKFIASQPDAPKVKTVVKFERIDSATYGRNIDRCIKAYRVAGLSGKLTVRGDNRLTGSSGVKLEPAEVDKQIKQLMQLRKELGEQADEIAAYTYAYEFQDGRDSVVTFFVQMTPSNEVVAGSTNRRMLEYAPGGFPGAENFDLPQLPRKDLGQIEEAR